VDQGEIPRLRPPPTSTRTTASFESIYPDAVERRYPRLSATGLSPGPKVRNGIHLLGVWGRRFVAFHSWIVGVDRKFVLF
jgi:hypothetical protein